MLQGYLDHHRQFGNCLSTVYTDVNSFMSEHQNVFPRSLRPEIHLLLSNALEYSGDEAPATEQNFLRSHVSGTRRRMPPTRVQSKVLTCLSLPQKEVLVSQLGGAADGSISTRARLYREMGHRKYKMGSLGDDRRRQSEGYHSIPQHFPIPGNTPPIFSPWDPAFVRDLATLVHGGWHHLYHSCPMRNPIARPQSHACHSNPCTFCAWMF